MICDLCFNRYDKINGGFDIRVIANSFGDSRHKLEKVQDVALDVPPRRLLRRLLMLLDNLVKSYVTCQIIMAI
jgi:hypothetical protein